MRLEVDINTRQARFDINAIGDTFEEATPATVLKSSHQDSKVKDYFAGQPVIGALANRVSMEMLDGYLKERLNGIGPSFNEVKLALEAKLPILSSDAISDRVGALRILLRLKK